MQACIVFGFAYFSGKNLVGGKGDWWDVGLIALAGFWVGAILVKYLADRE